MYRSFQFIPADKRNNIAKISILKADQYILDLEDSVSVENKEIARDNIREFLSKQDNINNLWIRCNSISSEEFNLDSTLFKKFPNLGIVIPKVENEDQLDFLTEISSTNVIILIESFKGLENISFLASNPRIKGFGLGLEDMLTSFPRSSQDLVGLINGIYNKFIVTVKQYDKFCISGITPNYKNKVDLIEDCQKELSFGFDGKFSIHPSQIESINEFFSFSEKQVKWATRIIELSMKNENIGYSIIEGELVTPPKIKKAKKILSMMEEL